MRRDLTIKTGSLAGTSEFNVVAPIKKGFVPSLDAMTYKTRVKRVLRTLHIGRTGAHENELARVLSDAVERVGRIHSVKIAVLEPEDKVLLAVTFDGAWEAYVRVIWQKVARLLDLIFCNTEGYVLGWENSYEKWGAWLKQAQTEASFLYATPGLTVDDTRYLRMQERVYRREPAASGELIVTRIRIPTAEEIAEQSIFDKQGRVGIDPTNAGFSKPLTIEAAGRPAFRHGLRSLVGLYRLADVYPPDTADGQILRRAAHELLPEFMYMLKDNAYQRGVARALKRFEEPVRWILAAPAEVRGQVLPPDEPPLEDRGNVQGGILSGYPDVDHGGLLLLGFASPAALAAFLKGLRVTSAADSVEPGQIATNIAFTVEGLRVAGLSDDEVRDLPEEFVQGMERRAGLLGDVRVNHPRRWRLPALNWHLGVGAPDVGEGDSGPRVDLSAVHAVVQLRLRAPGLPPADAPAAPDPAAARAQLLAAMQGLVAADPGVTPLSLQWMHRRRNPTGEHFGFIDGNSQPVLSKSEDGIAFSNQVHLGEVLCGYPNLADDAGAHGDTPDRTRALLRDGSFLVLRKLRQDVEALEQALSTAVADAAAAGQALTREDFMAKMMGRWPGGDAKAGQPLILNPKPDSNDFHFNNDEQGAQCPFHAHIRRAHPRLTQPLPGSRPARIFRRGMSYGPHHDRNASDPQAVRASLDQERGLVFMAYNASLGEQFEVVQRWLSGGNSSDSYSGQSDPFLGIAEPGRRRYFRFEHQGQTVRMALDGSDRLHDEPRPFVRLEWGAYLFAPSRKTLETLQERAAAQGHKPVIWRADVGEAEIVRLRDVEKRLGDEAAAAAWKSALEDPQAAVDFTTASIWAAIREYHGGVLYTPFGVLVAERGMVEQVLADPERRLTVNGYLPRMQQSFGVLYLGLDAGQQDGAYERESEVCNRAILALDRESAFQHARQRTLAALQGLVDDAISYAQEDGEPHWDLTLDARELLEPLLAAFCEEWFGLSEEGGYFRRAGYRWDWQPGKPPTYPGHFLAPSRYIFQPHPGPEVGMIGTEHGGAVRRAMVAFLERFRADIEAPVTRAVLDSPLGKADLAFVARTIAGAMMGFVPTVEGNLRRILNEWLREGTLWSLRARYAGTAATDFTDACNRLRRDFIPAMQLRAVPEMIWRTAAVSHTLGEGPHQVAVKPGDIVVAASISATQQSLEQGHPNLYHAFGGNRREPGHPTHACPGADPARAVMLGFFSALVESPLALRAGPGPLTLSLEGPVPPPTGDAGVHERVFVLLRQPISVALAAAATPLVTFGDSWLYDGEDWDRPNLTESLLGRGFKASKSFASPGWRLQHMADNVLGQVKDYFTGLGQNELGPRALLIDGGGNDVTENFVFPWLTPLYDMLVESPGIGQDPLVAAKVNQFIDVKLFNHYKKIINTLKDVTTIPILIHAYDHPIPDGRSEIPLFSWLESSFDLRGITDRDLATDVMRRLIDRLNAMVANLAAAYPGRVHHVNLCNTLPKGQEYERFWANELHPTKEGFDLLAAVVAQKLTALNIP